jgi:hypothetical protein
MYNNPQAHRLKCLIYQIDYSPRRGVMADIPDLSKLDELDIATLEKALQLEEEQEWKMFCEKFKDTDLRKEEILFLFYLSALGKTARQIEERGRFKPDAP